MEKPNSYCDYCLPLPADDLHRIYHDSQYGFPLDSDDELFGRLILEINQAGLSWTTILKKQDYFRLAFSNFSIQEIAAYTEEDRERLFADERIIRNKLKINAVIFNAQKVMELQREHGSFDAWLKSHHLTLEEWVKLFKKIFKFTGGEITKEFLMSAGYLPGAHIEGCPVYQEILKAKPHWLAHKV